MERENRERREAWTCSGGGHAFREEGNGAECACGLKLLRVQIVDQLETREPSEELRALREICEAAKSFIARDRVDRYSVRGTKLTVWPGESNETAMATARHYRIALEDAVAAVEALGRAEGEEKTRMFSYEKISPDSDGKTHWRIADAEDNRIATSYAEENARFIVERLNAHPAAPRPYLPTEAEREVLASAMHLLLGGEPWEAGGVDSVLRALARARGETVEEQG